MWLLKYMIVLIENGANMIMKVYLGTKSIMNCTMSLGQKIKFDNLSKNLKSLPFPVSGAPQRSSLWISKKYCYSFNNNDGRCERGQNCKYPHVCEKCGGGHFKRLCRQPYKGKSQPKFNNRPKNDNVPNKKCF